MPLSDHEQKILDEIERRLAAEDPKFARSTAVATPRGVALHRIKRAAAGFLLGLGLLIAGLIAGLDSSNLLLAFGLAGFIVMLVAVLGIVKASRDIGPPAPAGKGSSWVERVEQRWRRRFERGDGRS